ncbi:hypothetical protein DVH24_026147 [Malus domestica]|uniref:Uncharacterized protein n=1 Tax=Malus domestica TaxID=3750 RepID=A0A498KIL0_MALDO|nr:hypothetical protein DVH24_026147 [Malus domestica]
MIAQLLGLGFKRCHTVSGFRRSMAWASEGSNRETGWREEIGEKGFRNSVIYSSCLAPLFILIREQETCSPSNTSCTRKDLLDLIRFLYMIY